MMRSKMNVIEESIKNPIGTQERVLFDNIKKLNLLFMEKSLVLMK